MIKGNALLRRFLLNDGASRFSVLDDETRPYQLVYEDNKEFEKLILSIFLLDKYYPSERELSFGTGRYNSFRNVRKDLEDLTAFLTNRRISIRFVPVQKRIVRQQRIDSREPSETKRRAPCLFSGGLDSAIGALVLTKNRIAPTLSHTATGNIVFGQARRLRDHPKLASLPMVVTDMRLRRATASASHIRTRGLLFLSNALVLASSMGKKQVYMPENGPLMINPRVSSISEPTKNAHPYLIETIERIHNHLTNSQIEIVPMFKNETKAEIIAKALADRIIDDTWSCFRVQGQSKMCGICFACFVRRLSVLAVGYREPVTSYQHDLFLVERHKLGYSMKFDLDILHDAFVYMHKLLIDNNLARDAMYMIPKGFFADGTKLMQNFALDMFLGLRNFVKTIGSPKLGPLGRFAKKLLQRISQSDLQEREERLKILVKEHSEIRFDTL